MCLTVIDEVIEPTTEWEDGWKVFGLARSGSNDLMFVFGRSIINGASVKKVPTNTPLKAENIIRHTDTGVAYNCGFHYLHSKKDALEYAKWLWVGCGDVKVMKVRVRGIRVRGTEALPDRNVAVSVADEMIVPEEA